MIFGQKIKVVKVNGDLGASFHLHAAK